METRIASIVALLILLLLPACGDPAPVVTVEVLHPLLGSEADARADAATSEQAAAFDALGAALEAEPALEDLVVAQPDEDATLGGGEAARFLWRDPAEAADTWFVGFRFGQRSAVDLHLLVPGGMPAEAALDPFSATMEAWTPSAAIWAHVVEHASAEEVTVTFVGFAADTPGTPLSQGRVTFRIADGR